MPKSRNWTEEELSAYLTRVSGIPPKQVSKPEPIKIPKPRMNGWETAYAQNLDLLKRAGLIKWYGFEAMKLRLADKTYYTPDFVVITQKTTFEEGAMEFHEVKGFWREDAIVKFKVAAEQFPFRFVALSKEKNGEWTIIKDIHVTK